MALLYAFVLAGFVASIAGPSIAAHAGSTQSTAIYEELCLIDGSGGELPHEHDHGADCCLPGCRVCAGCTPAAHGREVEAFAHARTAQRAGSSRRGVNPPALIAAAAPFGARGPPSS